jgi:serralysin
VLNGGAGSDTLIGGEGVDTFVFDSTLGLSSNVDAIVDFAAGDVISLDNDFFTALGAAGALSAVQFSSAAGLNGASVEGQTAGIYYDSTTGSLYYDADGFGGTAGVNFAVLNGVPTLSAASFVIQE